MNKRISYENVKGMFLDGQRLMVGGFGLVGCPLELVRALVDSNAKNLTIISNNLGEPGKGLGQLVLNGAVSKGIGSYFTSNHDVVHAHQAGDLAIELLPQGTMSEAIRAGGAGIGGFYTPTGVGTDLYGADAEVREIRGRQYVFQEALTADVALVRAHKADENGNLIYRKTARNFNPAMATAARTVIAEVEEIVPIGQLSPEEVVTPHIYVDHLLETGRP